MLIVYNRLNHFSFVGRPILLLHLNALAEPEDRACIRKEYNKEYDSNTKLSPQAIARHLKDRKLQSSRRHGKFLFGLLDQGGSVVFHFGMTGSLKYFKEKANEAKHTRVRFEFSNSAFLGFVCPRMFGQVDYTSDTIQYIKERYSRCAGGYSERIQRAVSG